MPVKLQDVTHSLPSFFVKNYESLSAKGTTDTAAQSTPIQAPPIQAPTIQTNKRKQLTIGHFAVKVPKYNEPNPSLSLLDVTSGGHILHCPPEAKSLPNQSTSSSAHEHNNHVIHQDPPSHVEDDIGQIYAHVKRLNDEEKYRFLTNISRPNPDFCYPATSGRKFQHKWLSEFPWLAYSKSLDGAFCLNCVLFASEESTHNGSKLNRLYRAPFRSWSNATSKFREHCEKSPLHRTATLMASHFRQCMEQKGKSIDLQVNELADQQVQKNREKLAPIVGAVIFLGRQNLALRGHRDDAKHYNEKKNNPGNMQELLKFLERFGKNTVFEDHMENAPKSATYRSKTTQDEIIAICREMITSKLSSEIKNAKYFSVLADEAADVSNVEQMPLVIRYVNTSSEICEAFMGFIQCDEGVSGEAISEKIVQGTEKLSLDMSLCHGQGYDGAGNMAGRCSGAAARIQAKYTKAPYVHCGSHALNLAVASACDIQVVRNMMGHVKVVSYFFNTSPKRFALLEKKIKELVPGAAHTHLIDVCRTRWIARLDGLDVFASVFVPVTHCLEIIKNNKGRSWNSDSVRDAGGLFHATISFQFILCLIVVSRCLEVTRPLTKQLQNASFDVVAANEKVKLLYATLCRMRSEISELHSQWYGEAEKVALSVNVSPSRPRIVQRQVHRRTLLQTV